MCFNYVQYLLLSKLCNYLWASRSSFGVYCAKESRMKICPHLKYKNISSAYALPFTLGHINLNNYYFIQKYQWRLRHQDISDVQSYTKYVLGRDFKWEDLGRPPVFGFHALLETWRSRHDDVKPDEISSLIAFSNLLVRPNNISFASI